MQLKTALTQQHIWTLFLLTVRKTNQKWCCGGFLRRVIPITVYSQHPNTSTAWGYISWWAVPCNITFCCKISTWTWCSHLMELMWMDFSLYLCHLTCISLIPLFFHLSVYLSAISIDVSVCVCTCVFELSRDGVQTGARLSPWVHSTYSADAVSQHISAVPWERGIEEEREGKEKAHLHQSIPHRPTCFFFTNTFVLCFCHVKC